MEIILFVGIPVFFVVAGTLAALTLTHEASGDIQTPPPPNKDASNARIVPFSFGQVADSETSAEEIVAALETRLRHEQNAARRFADDPSQDSLWIN